MAAAVCCRLRVGELVVCGVSDMTVWLVASVAEVKGNGI
jgi:hypothetical protein